MKILVLGSSGQLGKCLNDQLDMTKHEVIYASSKEIDITDLMLTKKQVIEISPDVIINAAAYTAVDKAEEDKKNANFINHIAVKNIAKICASLKIWLIHISTDYVFDGKSITSYKETDKTNPQCIYGKTKLQGELAIMSSGCKHIIIRTSWVFSEYGNNFLKTMLHLGKERDELNIVGDQIGCPTYAQDIAKSIVRLISSLKTKNTNSLFHFCGDDPISWYDFAVEIFKKAKLRNLKTPSLVKSIKTSSYFTAASRPSFSVLDCSKIDNEYGIKASNWRYGIVQAIEKLKQ